MKKFAKRTLWICMAVLIFMLSACDQAPSDREETTTAPPVIPNKGDEFSFVLNEDGVSYTAHHDWVDDTTVIVPSSYKGLPVTRIAGSRELSWILSGEVSITIPSTVVEITSDFLGAFQKIGSITLLGENPAYHMSGSCLIETESQTLLRAWGDGTIPVDGSVKRIKECAFFWNEDIESVHIPASVTEIDKRAFVGIPSLKTITCDGENPVYRVLDNCLIDTRTGTLVKGCSSSVIPSDGSVTRIGHNAFLHCYGLERVIIPDCVTEIDESAFSYCTGLTELVIGENVTSIGDSAFFQCESLTSVTIPDSVQTIGTSAFYLCTSLKSITLGTGLKRIGNIAFSHCSALESLTFSEGIEEISSSMLSDCTMLKWVVIPKSVVTVRHGVGDDEGGYSVYYAGSESEWSQIAAQSTSGIMKANRYYYSETPAASGWHYDENGTPVRW